jgi:hypothetical protein
MEVTLMGHDLDAREIHSRMFALECRIDQISALKTRIKELEAALALMCQGQQSQDERICAIERGAKVPEGN